jgi:membrane-bound lytic murein transglycosylase B
LLYYYTVRKEKEDKLKKIILLSMFSSIVWASNCSNLNKEQKELCSWISKEKQINQNYVYETFKNPLFNENDEKTLRLIKPKQIKKHRSNEKKANIALTRYVDKMVANIKEYKEVYDKAEELFGVNREIIAGILMKETRLGGYEPKHSAIQTLSTIFRNIKPDTKRNKWLYKLSKNNLKDLIAYCSETGIEASKCDFKSSYIGAIGFPQFMPSSFKYIVPYKGKYSYLDNIPDSIMSVANYLSERGKYRGKFNFKEIDNIEKIEKEWYKFADQNENASFSYYKEGKYQCFSCNKWELNNMSKYLKDIMKYNNSSNYAIGVFGLAWRTHQKLEEENFKNQKEIVKTDTMGMEEFVIKEEEIKKPKEKLIIKKLSLEQRVNKVEEGINKPKTFTQEMEMLSKSNIDFSAPARGMLLVFEEPKKEEIKEKPLIGTLFKEVETKKILPTKKEIKKVVKKEPKKIIHKVKKGDTFYKLSKKYDKSIKEIMSLNNKKTTKLSIGEKLRVY